MSEVSPNSDGRIPLLVIVEPPSARRQGLVLILTGNAAAPSGYAIVRHADAAAVAQEGHCPCCRTPSDLVTALRQLFLERVRGETAFSGIVIEGGDAIAAQIAADPLLAARYAILQG